MEDTSSSSSDVPTQNTSNKSWVSTIISILMTVGALYVAWIRCGKKFEWLPFLMALLFSPFYLIYAAIMYFTEKKPVQTQQQKRKRQQQQKRKKQIQLKTTTPTPTPTTTIARVV